MKLISKIKLTLVLLLLPSWAFAFLTDNDPVYFFDLVARAPIVLKGKVTQVVLPEKGRSYFLYHVQSEQVLSGELKEKDIKIFQEKIFPEDPPVMVSDTSVLLFLAAMPKYTAYQKAFQEGAHYRLYGGSSGVWALANQKNALNLAQAILAAKNDGGISPVERKNLLLALLTSPEQKIREAGAMGLGKEDLSSGSLSGEEEQKIYQSLLSSPLGKKEQVALIKALKDSRSVAVLKKIANGTQGTRKWAAVRALKELGFPRSSEELARDYERGDLDEKTRAMGMMAQRQDGAAQKFLHQVIRGSDDYTVKRAVIAKMGEVGGKANERVLIKNIQHPEEKVMAQVLLALGSMNSQSSVSQIIPLLKSDSKILRDAAILSLYQNKDPQAVKYFQERYVKDAHGHLTPKRHFSDVPGAKRPPQGGHSHSHPDH